MYCFVYNREHKKCTRSYDIRREFAKYRQNIPYIKTFGVFKNYNIKNGAILAPFFYCLLLLLRFLDCADGAAVFTCSAIDALLGIDNVFAVAFRNCSDRASICARTALDAVITDNSGHSFFSLQKYIRFRLQ